MVERGEFKDVSDVNSSYNSLPDPVIVWLTGHIEYLMAIVGPVNASAILLEFSNLMSRMVNRI